MKKMKRIIFMAMLCLISGAWMLSATNYYSCDFENDEDTTRWVLNPAANQTIAGRLVNKWYIGSLGNYASDGQRGLYISDNGGIDAHYTASGCWVFAYDLVSLPRLQTGSYSVCFDYCAMENQISDVDGLYLLWIPQTDDYGDNVQVNSILSSMETVPRKYEEYIIPLQPRKDNMTGAATWHHCVASIPGNRCDGTPHYLAFVWANSTKLAQQPGAMIDNIEIVDSIPCDAPAHMDVTYANGQHTLSWSAIASVYEVSVYAYETGQWYGPYETTDTSYVFAGLPVSMTDFIVRSKCSSNTYGAKTILGKFVYYPDQLCVDYYDLSKAKCYINNSTPVNTLTFDDFREVQAVDYGPSQIASRHTVHSDKDELELRTGNMAHTVPEGEQASVRLGNWDNGSQAERIEFSFVVDTAESHILQMKYMPILEAPGHEDGENPRFTMDVLIGDVTIDTCAHADFNSNGVCDYLGLKPGAEEQGWHITRYEVSQYSTDIVWKEWTTVGVNLNKPEYNGEVVTIRLTTYDCVFTAHCGYAYFTLGCANGKLKMHDSLEGKVYGAPEGFTYSWYHAADSVHRNARKIIPEEYVLSHEQTFAVNADDRSVYAVDCMFVQDSTNYFTLYTSELNVPSDLETIENDGIDVKVRKILRDGQILIQRGDRTYTVTGQELK